MNECSSCRRSTGTQYKELTTLTTWARFKMDDDVDMHEAGQLQHQDEQQQQQQQQEDAIEDVDEQEDEGEQDDDADSVQVMLEDFARDIERMQQNDPEIDDYYTDLYLDDSRAILIGRALLGNTALAELTVTFMGQPHFTSRGARAFAGGVAGSQIKTLNLEGTENPPLEMSQLCARSLQKLTLSFPIRDEFAIQLSESLIECKLLQNLNIQVDRMTLRGAKALSSYLSVSPIADLTFDVHNDAAAAALDDAVTTLKMETLFSEGVQHSQSIHDLSLYTILGDMYALATTTLPKLHQLSIGNVPLSLTEVEFLTYGLSGTKQLHTLSLWHCRLNHEHMNVLSRVLGDHPSIKKLALDSNKIGDAGIASFVKHWRRKSTIRELALSSNGVSFKGAEILSKALSNHQALRSLDLEDNTLIGYNGLKIIGEVLPFTKLRKLDLFHVVNWIKYEDAAVCDAAVIQEAKRMAASKALLEGVRGNGHLRYLRLDNLNLPTCVMDEIDVYVQANSYNRRAVLWSQHRLPCGVWSHFLAKEKMTSSFMFLFLRELPTLIRRQLQ